MSDSEPEASDPRPEVDAWSAFVDGLRDAGDRVATDTADLDATERADAYRSLIRALNNQLSRFEVDRQRPELVAFNGWRERFFMDNPDFRYWVADIADDGAYQIVGHPGDAAYVSVTVYAGRGSVGADAVGRLDSDELTVDEHGNYDIVIARDDPGDAPNWIPLVDGATAVWVRHFHRDAGTDELGGCRIDPIGSPPVPAPINPDRFGRHLTRLGGAMAFVPSAWSAAMAAEDGRINEIRHWSEMTGGAVYTEPGIHYLRGAWELEPGEALVIDGPVVACRYWNALLYSRFLNSLDFRARSVSITGSAATVVDGRYRVVVSAERPPPSAGDWLDTEGRRSGLVVFRWLHPESDPELPTVTCCRVADLETDR